MAFTSEKDVEDACLSWFAGLGYEVLASDNLVAGSVYGERAEASDVVLRGRLDEAVARLLEAVHELPMKGLVVLLEGGRVVPKELPERLVTRLFGSLWVVEIARDGADGGGVKGVRIRLFDFEDPEQNDWMVTSQVRVFDRLTGTGQTRIPDVIVFVNGLPLAVIELKGAEAESNVWDAVQRSKPTRSTCRRSSCPTCCSSLRTK